MPVDAFGRVLLVVLAAIGWTIAAPDSGWAQVVVVSLFGAVVSLAFQASGVRRSVAVGALVAWAAAVGAAIVGAAVNQSAVTVALGLVLVAAALGAILYRLAQHPVVTPKTVGGALASYLLLGMLFTFLYATVDAVVSGPVLHGIGTVELRDYLYHSFITLTTVGYGDVFPATDVARALSVLEALTGQLYLVTVVALAVGRVGQRRRGPDDEAAGRPEDRAT